MDAITFLDFARTPDSITINEDGTYRLCLEHSPSVIAKRVPDLEKKFGSEGMVFCTEMPHIHVVVYDLYFVKENQEYALEIRVSYDTNLITTYTFTRAPNQEWGLTESETLIEEKKHVFQYLSEQPRFRLLFVTGLLDTTK